MSAPGELRMRVDNGVNLTLTGLGILTIEGAQGPHTAVLNGCQMLELAEALIAKARHPTYGYMDKRRNHVSDTR